MIHAAQLIAAGAREIVDLMGPTIEFLTPNDSDDGPCLMRGTIPPGGLVPMHSHADVETFYAVSGELEGLSETAGGFIWETIRPGDMFHVPGGVKHGFRNRSQQASIAIIVSTQRLARFFREVGKPIAPGIVPGPPSDEAIRHFLQVADRYGYWNATPEENARVGIRF